MKIFFLTLLMTISHSYAQLVDNTEVDPEVMEALLDASRASSDPSRDPLEGIVTETPMQQRAKEAAIELKKTGNEINSVKPVVAPKPQPKKNTPTIISKEEEEMLKMWEAEQSKAQAKKEGKPASNRKPIYVPAPVEEMDQEGVFMERDSSKIVVKRMNHMDSVSIRMCFSAGLNIVLDADIQDEFQRIILDDKIFFDATEMDNHRGAYVRLKRPVPEGKHWESALRLIRKSDDKIYLINLIGLPCPNYGMTPFPKVVVIKDHIGLIQANNKVLTPEDTIISLSKGLPRIQKNRIRIYDMVASSGSNWVVFGVEVQYPNGGKTTMPKMVILDNLQVSQIPSKLEYLPVHSQKATDARGVSTLRFKLSVNINKNYVLKSRYLHAMFLDEDAGHYQYVRVDTLPYFLSLIRRGFEL